MVYYIFHLRMTYYLAFKNKKKFFKIKKEKKENHLNNIFIYSNIYVLYF